MSNSIMKLGPSKDAPRRLFLNAIDNEDGKKGWPIWINEILGTERLIGHKARLFLQKSNNGAKWFEISAPIRRVDENGNYLNEPRANEKNNWIDKDGNEVDSLEKAEQQYQIVKDEDNNFVHGKMGTINVINTRKDHKTGEYVPTKSTYLKVKFYTDQEAIRMQHTLFQYHNAPDKEKEKWLEKLNQQQKEMGSTFTMFVNEGAEFLTKLGFEVRTSEMEQTAQPG